MEKLKQMIIDGEMEETVEEVKRLLNDGVDAERVMNEALIAAMDVVGDLFQKGEFYLPEMMVASRAMQSGLDIIQPYLTESKHEAIGKVIMGTVNGDLHDIGKNLVIMSLKGAGLEVIDLGIDVEPAKFVEAIKEHNPDVVGLSALLTTTMLNMEKTVKAIKESAPSVKVMVGGAPLTKAFSDEIGADFYGVDSTAGKNFAREVAGAKS